MEDRHSCAESARKAQRERTFRHKDNVLLMNDRGEDLRLRRGGRAAIVALVGHGDATKGVLVDDVVNGGSGQGKQGRTHERWTKGRWWRR